MKGEIQGCLFDTERGGCTESCRQLLSEMCWICPVSKFFSSCLYLILLLVDCICANRLGGVCYKWN